MAGSSRVATLGVALPVDPGAHVVDATAPASAPFHARAHARPRARPRACPISLAPRRARPRPGRPRSVPLKDSRCRASQQRRWGWVTLAARRRSRGRARAIFFILHDNAVSTVNADCPGELLPSVGQERRSTARESNARTVRERSRSLSSPRPRWRSERASCSSRPRRDHPRPAIDVTAGAPGAPAGLSLHGDVLSDPRVAFAKDRSVSSSEPASRARSLSCRPGSSAPASPRARPRAPGPSSRRRRTRDRFSPRPAPRRGPACSARER